MAGRTAVAQIDVGNAYINLGIGLDPQRINATPFQPSSFRNAPHKKAVDFLHAVYNKSIEFNRVSKYFLYFSLSRGLDTSYRGV